MNQHVRISMGEQNQRDDSIHLSFWVADDETFEAIGRSIPELKRQFPAIENVRVQVRNPYISPHQIGLTIVLVGGAMAKGVAQKIGTDVYAWFKSKFKTKIKRKSHKPISKKTATKATMGSHWEQTSYPLNYQLSRRVEDVADELSQRQREGLQPLRKHVEELYQISRILKGLEVKGKH